MDYFPLSLAGGSAFCNREEEQKHLKYNLLESRPTLIIAPRRYGKTSLAMHTLNHLKLHFAAFDFLSAVTLHDIEKIILKGVGLLIGRIEKGPKKALKLATDLFSGLSIKFSLDALGLSIEINKKSVDTATNILNILERMEKLSAQYNKKIVLFFDEFQRLYQISEDQAVESVMRQVAQSSKNLSFVFSGSNRHILHQIFNDRNRPFYKLCDRITLDRISKDEYRKYISTAAVKSSKVIDDNAICKALGLTELHPYYVNVLCSRLWRLENITVEEVIHSWHQYTIEERSQVANEIDMLSVAQRKFLTILARVHGTNSPRSNEFQIQAEMPGATITQAINILEKKDYIYKDPDGYYKSLDPLISYVLSEE